MTLESFQAAVSLAGNRAFYAISAQRERVERAVLAYRKQMQLFLQPVQLDFIDDWLTYHYADDRGLAIDLIDVDAVIAQAFKHSELGFYSARRSGKYISLQNIVSQTVHHLETGDDCEAFGDDYLVFGRIFSYRGQHVLAEGHARLLAVHRAAIVDFCQQHYAKHSHGDYYSMADFIQANPTLLYSAYHVIETPLNESLEDMLCYEVIGAIEDQEAFKAFTTQFKPVEEDGNTSIFQWFDGDTLRAEVVVDEHLVHMECNRAEDSQWVVDILNEGRCGLGRIETRLTHLSDLIDS